MNLYAACARFVTLAISTIALGHPPDGHGPHDHEHCSQPARIRTWTNKSTGDVVRGAFLASRLEDGSTRISIERENGEIILFTLTDLVEADQAEAQRRIDEVSVAHAEQNEPLGFQQAGAQRTSEPLPINRDREEKPPQAATFDAFVPHVTTRWDSRWLYVESDGLPHVPGGQRSNFEFSHPLMVGITAWQQQVPLPQAYRGENAWQIPLHPEAAEKPVSAKEQLFRGAIALAANGVPIFNPIKNDGRTDTFLAGELDDFGGHCGRADDYHYHIAPTHLSKVLGDEAPIAYALDGYPIFGYFDPNARAGQARACPLGSREPLDRLNGHHAASPAGDRSDAKDTYHYHASEKYPYLNGGMHGKVTVKDGQIDPQPRATPVRDWLQPLRGARITGFKATGKPGERAWSLQYTIGGKPGSVNYRVNGEGRETKYQFEFVAPGGQKTNATYTAEQPRGTGAERRADGRRERGDDRARRGEPRGQRGDSERDAPRREPPPPKPESPERNPQKQSGDEFALTSTDVIDGRLAIDCTCDGSGRAPALAWSNPPTGTKCFAAVMHHVPPDGGVHVYMLVANISASAKALSTIDDVGTWGANTVNRRPEYAPPCSQGPGDKSYSITIYALSAPLPITEPLTRDALLAAIQDTTLATATLDLAYAHRRSDERKGARTRDGDDRGQGRRGVPREQPEDSRAGLIERLYTFKTEVPTHDVDVILARPTDRTVTVSVATSQPSRAIVEYWPADSTQRRTTEPVPSQQHELATIELSGLSPGRDYRYRIGWVRSGSATPTWGEESRFRTRPPPEMPFTFVIQADSHLDQGVEPKVYEQTLANMLSAKPDFVVDLGDTFMTDKRGRDFANALAQYDAQRWYLSRLAHSAPLFMVLGNHDGEKGTSGNAADDIGPWSFRQRTSRFPAPLIDDRVYTGKTDIQNGVGANYYAFEWGDALFVVLDPFWSTTERIRGGGGGNRAARGSADAAEQPRDRRSDSEALKPIDASWNSTLGRTQYDWLTRTLEKSNAKYRFVFIHHLVGGLGGAESRGGTDSAPYFEWGGANADGSAGFAEHRRGWPMPIHDLLVKNGVSAVFHGHDHLYARGERDGLVYQCVPQPGNPAGHTRSAAQYGYRSGPILGSPGHVRVSVQPDRAAVEFIRTAVEGLGGNQRGERSDQDANGRVIHRYELSPRRPN